MLVLTILTQQEKGLIPTEDLEVEQYLVLLEELVLVQLIKDMVGTQEVLQMQVYGLVEVVEQELQEITVVLEVQD